MGKMKLEDIHHDLLCVFRAYMNTYGQKPLKAFSSEAARIKWRKAQDAIYLASPDCACGFLDRVKAFLGENK